MPEIPVLGKLRLRTAWATQPDPISEKNKEANKQNSNN
jgi:hypothetical protein